MYRDNRYLLADHNARKRTTFWGLPGGHIEWREDPMEAARREVHEELNIHISDLQWVGEYVYKNRLHAVYAAATDTAEFELDFSELAQVRWFSAREIAHLRDFKQLHAGYEYDAVIALQALQKSG